MWLQQTGFTQCAEDDGEAGERECDRSHRRCVSHRLRQPPTRQPSAFQQSPGVEKEDPEPGQGGGQAKTERDHQSQPEPDPPERDGAKQHHQRRWARDQPTGNAQRQESAPGDRRRWQVRMCMPAMAVGKVVLVAMPMVMIAKMFMVVRMVVLMDVVMVMADCGSA